MRLFPKDLNKVIESSVRFCGKNYDAKIESISKTGKTIKASAGGNLHTFTYSENTEIYHTGNGYTLILGMS